MPASNNPTLAKGVQALYPATHQSVSYTATHGVISNAVTSSIIRVVCTTVAHIKIGTAPVATTSDVYMPAGVVEYFRVEPGVKVSAIQSAAGGTLHVTEMD